MVLLWMVTISGSGRRLTPHGRAWSKVSRNILILFEHQLCWCAGQLETEWTVKDSERFHVLADTTYCFEVRASNLKGPGAIALLKATTAPPEPPDQMDPVALIENQRHSLSVSWQDAKPNGAEVTGYTLRTKPEGAPDEAYQTVLDQIPAHRFILPELEADTEHCFQVRGECENPHYELVGDWSDEVVFRTREPLPPSGVALFVLCVS